MSSLLGRITGQAGGLRHQIATALAGTFALNLTSKFLMFVTTMLLARLMGPQNYGVYASVIAIVTLVGVPASLGLPNLITREVATYRARESWSLMKGLLLRANQAEIAVTILLAFVVWGLQSWVGGHREFTKLLIWSTFALLPLTQFGALRWATLRGLHHVVLGLVPETLVMPIVFLLSIGLVNWISPGIFGPQLVITLRLIAVGLAFVVGTIFLLARLPLELRIVRADYQLGYWARSTWPMMWVVAMNVITMQTDVVMLAALRGSTDAGIYQVAARAAELVALVSVISSATLQPTIARLYAQSDLVRLKQVTCKVTRIMFGAALLAALLFITSGSELLKLFYGVAYTSGAVALSILSTSWVLVALNGPARDTLIMTGGEKTVAFSISTAASLNVVLNLLLIPQFGIVGAALATATSLITCNIGYAIGVRRRLLFWPGPL